MPAWCAPSKGIAASAVLPADALWPGHDGRRADPGNAERRTPGGEAEDAAAGDRRLGHDTTVAVSWESGSDSASTLAARSLTCSSVRSV